jgi:hypothetical protein
MMGVLQQELISRSFKVVVVVVRRRRVHRRQVQVGNMWLRNLLRKERQRGRSRGRRLQRDGDTKGRLRLRTIQISRMGRWASMSILISMSMSIARSSNFTSGSLVITSRLSFQPPSAVLLQLPQMAGMRGRNNLSHKGGRRERRTRSRREMRRIAGMSGSSCGSSGNTSSKEGRHLISCTNTSIGGIIKCQTCMMRNHNKRRARKRQIEGKHTSSHHPSIPCQN